MRLILRDYLNAIENAPERCTTSYTRREETYRPGEGTYHLYQDKIDAANALHEAVWDTEAEERAAMLVGARITRLQRQSTEWTELPLPACRT